MSVIGLWVCAIIIAFTPAVLIFLLAREWEKKIHEKSSWYNPEKPMRNLLGFFLSVSEVICFQCIYISILFLPLILIWSEKELATVIVSFFWCWVCWISFKENI